MVHVVENGANKVIFVVHLPKRGGGRRRREGIGGREEIGGREGERRKEERAGSFPQKN